MSEKRCVLCNKPYDYKYVMFGRGCLDNLYSFLEFSKKPIIFWNKELDLCTRIAWRNHKFFLNKNKKYELAKKYIALSYLNKINYDSLNDIKESIMNDIKSTSAFSRNNIETISFKLNDIYKLFNYFQKFNELIESCKKIDWENIDELTAKNVINGMSYIFDIKKKTNPISYAVFYAMQYTFWKVVVVGGILAGKHLAAKCLDNSLTLFGQNPEDLTIDDEKTIEEIINDTGFKKKIVELAKKYGKETGKFNSKDYEKDGTALRFEDGDLFFAVHDATMFVKAQNNSNNTWNLEIEINDVYDFTDFNDLKEYADSEDKKIMDIFSTVLNNLGVVSSEYGVLKKYKITIKFELNNYVIE